MPTYAPPAPSLTGTKLSVDYLLNNPQVLFRLLRTIDQQHHVGGLLLKGRVDVTGSGAVAYETGESITVDELPDQVAELEDYKLVDDSGATVSLAQAVKSGFATLVSDEAVSRNRLDVMGRKLTKLGNTAAAAFDAIVISAVDSAVTATHAAAGVWDGTTANPYRDLLLAIAKVISLNEGFRPDIAVLSPLQYAYLVSQLTELRSVLVSSEPDVLATGVVRTVSGLTIVQSTNSITAPLIADSTQLGSIAYERLGGGYVGDPADPLSIESKAWHRDDKDGWQIQVRKTSVPMVQEPAAAIKLEGVGV